MQRQLRTETSGGAYATLRADFYSALQQIYGQPGEDNALETVFNDFVTAMQVARDVSRIPSASRYRC